MSPCPINAALLRPILAVGLLLADLTNPSVSHLISLLSC
jgi:hypothetical protein